MKSVFAPMYDHYRNLPPATALFNPLCDVPAVLREEHELIEFWKLSNEYYSPEFGIKYLLNVNLYPFQMAVIRAIVGHKFPMILFSRGGSKTFTLAVYALYHAIMFPGARIVLVSASFRQSKLIFSEITRIYENSPLLRAISNGAPKISTDHCHFEVCGSSIKALPLGTGDKIRGERGHVILADEFNSIPIEVFDVVVRGFAATQADPWAKTRSVMIDSIHSDRKTGLIKPDQVMADFMVAEGNKIVLSGTAGFKNGTFYRMFSQYSKILSNKVSGKIRDYAELFREENIDGEHEIDHRDYCIMLFDYLSLPIGMMEKKVIDNARATMPKVLFEMEYMCKFADDSYGFFKMRDIEAATAPSNGFMVRLNGIPNKSYVMGVDPARTTDRFGLCIVEAGPPHRLVYQWTCQNKPFSYSATKMRQLMRRFNIVGIAIDEGGGGFAIEELLNKSEIMDKDDRKVYRHDDSSAEAQAGRRILFMFNFNSGWIEDANTLLQKNIEDRALMFPYPSVGADFSQEIDDVIFEVNELKQELVAIEVTHTRTGKKHFDLAPPDIRKDAGTAVRHKDRYSSLLLANFLASRFVKLSEGDMASARKIYEDSYKFGGWLNP